MIRLVLLFVLLVGVVSEGVWELKPGHAVVQIGTTPNVTLECLATGYINDLQEMFRMRILRKNDSQDRDEPIASMDMNSKITTRIVEVYATGFVGVKDVSKSRLVVVWPIATEKTVGKFKCEIVAYDQDGSPVTMFAKPISINKKTRTPEESIAEARTEFQTKLNVLQNESQEADAILQKNISECNRRRQEEIGKLAQEIIEMKKSNAYELARQHEKNTLILQEMSRLRNDAQQSNDEFKTEITFVKSLINNQTQNATTKQIQDAFTKLREEISKLRKENNETDVQLKYELSDSMKQCQAAKENLLKEISDFKNMTTETMLEVTENVRQRLRRGMYELRNASEEESMKIKKLILDAKIIISGLKNETSNEVGRRADETEARLQQAVRELKNENKETLAKLQQEMNRRMHTSDQLQKQLQDVEKEIDLKLSKLTKQTLKSKAKLEQEIANATTVLRNELTVLDEKAKEEHTKIYSNLFNKTNESRDSNITLIVTDLFNRTNSLQMNWEETMNQIHSKSKHLVDWISTIDEKYANITDNLWANLSKKSECTCPTSLPPVPTTFTPSPRTTSTTTTRTPAPVVTDWPEGNFGLVATDTGCQEAEGFTWEEGWIQFHTASDFNQDVVSPRNHFKRPIFRMFGSDNFFQLHYCLKKVSVNNATGWPAGSYCVNRVNGHCPTGFKSGYINYDGEHSHVQHRHDNPPDIESQDGSVDRVYYCCRKDGDPNTSIALPNTKPFFLYRAKKATCQRVLGMEVSEEVIQIDTSHEDNQDSFEDPDNHPDVKLHPVQHTLCYYAPTPRR